MSGRQSEILSSFLLLLIAIVVAVGLFQWWRVNQEIERIHMETARMVIGADEKLAETVRDLEQTLKDRLEYQFDLSEDPLDLTRVITSKKLLEKMGVDEFERSKQQMRLAATIVGRDGSAAIVIRFQGSNHVLRVGDLISGWTVSEIDEETAVLTRAGARRVLHNEKAPETIGGGGRQMSVDVPENIAARRGNY